PSPGTVLMRSLSLLVLLLSGASVTYSQTFKLPTANRAIFNYKEQDHYFCGTVGRTWESGTYGCVRSGGWQMHEGIDIKSIQRDKSGEPTDPILATADGVVVYINGKPGLSNYGNYIVLRHLIDGIEIYSLYAHLSQVRTGLKVGQAVKAGDAIALMGRTTNTREPISKERAHLHFELNIFVSERFDAWHKKYYAGRNDHGLWNGQNLLGLDPTLALLVSHREGKDFNLVRWIQNNPELCRVQVRDTNFPWLKRYAPLIEKRPGFNEPIVGYELVLNYNGVPIKAIPRSASEMKSRGKYYLLSVNNAEYKKSPCRKLVVQKGGKWELAENGLRLLDLLTH
ncbi:MAG: M23 family metallopeptidase, partial [Limisphaerales bacterium]